MRRFLCSGLLGTLLAAGLAQAAASATPAAAPPPPPPPPASACGLALAAQAAPPADASKQPADQRKKVNLDGVYDPCRLSDAERDSDIGNSTGAALQDQDDQVHAWLEWNRRQRADSETALRYGLAETDIGGAGGQRLHGLDGWRAALGGGRVDDGLEQVELLPANVTPAVPEAPASLMALAGLTTLATLAAWRRRARGQ